MLHKMKNWEPPADWLKITTVDALQVATVRDSSTWS